MSLIIFTFALFANIWIWKIYSFSIITGLSVTLASFLVYLYFYKDKPVFKITFILSVLFLFFVFVNTTQVKPITEISDHELHIRQVRMSQYPPLTIKLKEKNIRIPVASLFENRKESVVFFRMLENMFFVSDPNLYFFANHPRETSGIKEFEKYPYILLPFFLYGTTRLIRNKKKNLFFGLLTAGIITAGLVGSQNPMGPVLFFPFLTFVIFLGLSELLNKTPMRKSAVFVFLILYMAVMIQTISYELY